MSVIPPRLNTVLNISQDGSITFKSARQRDITVSLAAPGVNWQFVLKINNAVGGIGFAALELHFAAGGGQINWPAALNIPVVVHDRGPAPVPVPPPAPVQLAWVNVGLVVPGPAQLFIFHGNEYLITGFGGVAGGIRFLARNNTPYNNLAIITQMQSILLLT